MSDEAGKYSEQIKSFESAPDSNPYLSKNASVRWIQSIVDDCGHGGSVACEYHVIDTSNACWPERSLALY